MKTIFIITCSSQKIKTESPARDLYLSERFILAKKLADEYADQWFIISAKYGLLEPDQVVAPYDKNLKELSLQEYKLWSEKNIRKLDYCLTEKINFICLGEEEYFLDIETYLLRQGNTINIPFRHIEKDNRVPWLRLAQLYNKRFQDVSKFYRMMQDLQLNSSQLRLFSECSGAMNWPKRGLYIYFRENENRLFSGNNLKVIRVGTHAVSLSSASSLWQRIKTHQGNLQGIGNHRSSVFRMHIGSSILAKEKISLSSWGKNIEISKDQEKLELEIEREVTIYMNNMLISYLDIGDNPSKNSDRAYLEQNIIGLLSGPIAPIDIADESWLGYYCDNYAVRRSSLWNVNHTRMEYDPDFFAVLQHYIDVTSGKIEGHSESIAPSYWLENSKTGYQQGSLKLF
jgi:hypothetical protein